MERPGAKQKTAGDSNTRCNQQSTNVLFLNIQIIWANGIVDCDIPVKIRRGTCQLFFFSSFSVLLLLAGECCRLRITRVNDLHGLLQDAALVLGARDGGGNSGSQIAAQVCRSRSRPSALLLDRGSSVCMSEVRTDRSTTTGCLLSQRGNRGGASQRGREQTDAAPESVLSLTEPTSAMQCNWSCVATGVRCSALTPMSLE